MLLLPLLRPAAWLCCVLLAAVCHSGPATAQTGEMRVLLMVVDGNEPVPRKIRHYENNQVTSMAWTDVATLHHFAFERDTSFASLFAEMSFGQLTLTGDTLLMAFPHDASDLTWQQWTALADAEAQNRGFSLSDYDRYLYILPSWPQGAPGAGGAVDPRGWCTFLGSIELGCVFHEFGHTIGLRHAGELTSDGTNNEYGDDSDGLMGSGFNCQVNVVNKHLAGWLTGARLQTLDAPGSASFTLAAQSVAADTPQAVQIINPGANPVTGVVNTFVSFRDGGGFDGQLRDSLPDINGDEVVDAVLVHQWYRVGGGATIYRRALEQGETYDEYGVTVTVDQISGDDATVTVTRAAYDPAPPEVTITPQNFNTQPGQLQYYSVSVTNPNDPSEVPFESYYDLTFTPIGPGWVMGWGAVIEPVAPGQTKDFQFLVVSPWNAALGTYAFTITATDPNGDAGPVSDEASASYTLLGPEVDTDPPSAPTGLTGSSDGSSVFLNWEPAADDESGIGGYQVLRDDSSNAGGFELIGSPTGVSYADTSVTRGYRYWYAVQAFDAAGNVGPASEVFAITAPWACEDGRDNDNDGLVDSDDPDCSEVPYWEEAPCGLGFELALLLPGLMWLRRRRQA